MAESAVSGSGRNRHAATRSMRSLPLGYSEKEAKAALARLDPGCAIPEAIRQALKLLSKVA